MLRLSSVAPVVLALLLAAAEAGGVPCPGTGAKLKVIVNNPTATTGHVVTISGNAITNQVTCTGQQDTYALNVTLNQLGDNEFIIPAGGGLDTGMWVNHISAASGQFQHQQRPVLIAASPTNYATVRWTYYPTVVSVNQSGDAATGSCIFQPTCTFRQAIDAANVLAQFSGTPAILIQFALSPGTMTQAFLLDVGVAGNATRITIDGTDADGDPYIVGDALAAAQGNQDAFNRTVDLADVTSLDILGDNVTIKGLAINNTVTTAPPNSTLIESSGDDTRIEAVRLDGGATGTCGSCVSDNRNLVTLNGSGTVANIEGRAAFSNGVRLASGAVSDSWLHHNYASGVLVADDAQLSRNLVELIGRRANGTVVTTDGVGVRGNALSAITSDANVIRNSTSHGVRARPIPNDALFFTDDYVCGNGDEGIFLFEAIGALPDANGTGLGVTYNASDGVEIDPSVSSSTFVSLSNSAFTANDPSSCGFLNVSSASATAINNQWRGVLTGSCSGSPDTQFGACVTYTCSVQNYKDVAITLDTQPTFPGSALLRGQTIRVQGNGFNAVDGNPLSTSASCALGSEDVSANNCCRKKSKANVCVTVPGSSPPSPPTDGSNCVALFDAASRWFPLQVTSVTPTTIVTEVPDPVHLCTGASSEIIRIVKQGTTAQIQDTDSYCRNI